MTDSDRPTSSPDGTHVLSPPRDDRDREASAAAFESVLFEHGGDGAESERLDEPSFCRDLNLDQVLDAMVAAVSNTT
jgi:hypothetical protein